MKNIIIAILTIVTLSVSVTSCSPCKGLKAHPDYGQKFK